MLAVTIPDELAAGVALLLAAGLVTLFAWLLSTVVKLAGLVAVITERLDGHDEDHHHHAARIDSLERYRWRNATTPIGEGHS